jgi:hypothetical protein
VAAARRLASLPFRQRTGSGWPGQPLLADVPGGQGYYIWYRRQAKRRRNGA